MRQMGITENIVAEMIEKSSCVWVATDKKIVVFSMGLPEQGCLLVAFFLPDYEGRGLGRRLVEGAEQQLFKHHEIAWLETDKKSRTANFYMRPGWSNKMNLDGTDIRLEKHRSM